MARQAAVAVENNFKNGLITEATGLNFPENACTDTLNCEFEVDGSVTRRLGFDFEVDFTTKTINRTNSVVVTYLWKNVAGNGNTTILVMQVGPTLYFYKTAGENVSSGAIASTVTLTPVSGAPTPETVEAQFSDGNGLLFVTHPYCEPMRVSYDASSDVATATNITLKIRDFEGATADALGIDERPTSTLAGLTVSHAYNLRNQGWNTTNLTAWDTAQTTMPSNSDVMWRFKDSSDNFDASDASIKRITLGNTPAPKGHYILTLSNQDRDTAAGTSGVTATTTGSQRVSTSAFFAGRVFYSGINYVGVNSKIYFTQVIERPEQYGFCYQSNDPTAEDLFDLLPTDGGVISIPEAGTIYKLVTIPLGLAVFAANGVWFITGSTGIGFTANDYTQQKLALITTLSASSFVDVSGYPAWWNAEGIYILTSEGNIPSIKSLTDGKIKSFYDDIPLASKRYAKGFYQNVDQKIHWLYRSEGTTQVTNIYEYDSVLNFNARTGAFYPWVISDSDVKVNAIFLSDSITGAISAENIVDNSAVLMVDSSGNQLVSFTTARDSSAEPINKFLVSYFNGTSYVFTFAELRNSDYLDWLQYDSVGVNFDSYFVTGYKIRGEGLRKFQTNWVRIFSNVSDSVSYYFQGIWDYALTGSGTGRWSTRQYINHDDTNYSTASRRIKVRGHGLALQFRVQSVNGEPFDISGWSDLDSGNAVP